MDLSKPALQQNYLKSLVDLHIVEKNLVKNHNGKEAYYSLKPFSLFLVINPDNGMGLTITSSSPYELPLLLTEQIENSEFKEDVNLMLQRFSGMNIGKRPECVILYGSVAGGEGTRKSDIDIAVLRTEWDDRIKGDYLELISEITIDTRHQIKPVFYTVSEFGRNDNPLLNEVKESGIVIFGELFGGREIWKEMKKYGNITI